jgi:prepilin-type N-terminal cleavage/methylation domain-containing protein
MRAWRSCREFRHEGGMTLMEMSIVLAIVGTLAVFAGTELQGLMERVNLDAATSEVIGDLRYARTLAVWERQPIQVAVDQIHPAMTILRSSNPTDPVRPPRDLTRRGISALSSTGGSFLSFSARGTSATPTTLTLESRHGVRRVVTVSLTGITRAR